MKTFRMILLTALFTFCTLPSFGIGRSEKAKSTITLAGSGGYPPFNYLNDEDRIVGFDVDVAKEIASRLDMELEYVTTAWDGIIEGLLAEEYDGILGSMAVTDERLDVVEFSTPYYYSGAQIITRKDSDIDSIGDIDSTTVIGVVAGTTYERDVENLGGTARLYEDDNRTLMDLVDGRVDAVITDRIVALNAMRNIPGGTNLDFTGQLLRKERCAVAIRKEDPLLAEINAVLGAMRSDGTLTRISAKWFYGADITVQ